MPSLDWYHGAVERMLAGTLPNLETSDLRLALLEASHTPNLENLVFGDVNADELGDAGYNSGGDLLTNVAVTENAGTVTLDADDAVWSGVTWPTGARYAVAYIDDTPATLLFLVDLDSNRTPDNEDFAIRWSVDGISTLTQS